MAVIWDRYRRDLGFFQRNKTGKQLKMRSVGTPVCMTKISTSGLRTTRATCSQIVASQKRTMLAKYLVCTSKIVDFQGLLTVMDRKDQRPSGLSVRGCFDASMVI